MDEKCAKVRRKLQACEDLEWLQAKKLPLQERVGSLNGLASSFFLVFTKNVCKAWRRPPSRSRSRSRRCRPRPRRPASSPRPPRLRPFGGNCFASFFVFFNLQILSFFPSEESARKQKSSKKDADLMPPFCA